MHILRYLPFAFILFIHSHTSLAENKDYAFALIGDLLYGVGINETNKEYDQLVKQINTDTSLRWVLHVGDIKRGAAPCSNDFLLDRKRRFSRFSPAFILTPGDNEWTDCHRYRAGGYDPIERLAKLRELFFAQDNQKLKAIDASYIRQSDSQKPYALFQENILWQKGAVVFSTVHMVGSDNGYAPFSLFSSASRSAKHDDEVVHRTNAALSWISKTFHIAKRQSAKGVFISTHANPGLADYMDEEDKSIFASFLKRVYQESINFDGQVVLAHGDSHHFRIDTPALYKGKAPKNFTRVETYGALNGHWIKVEIKPDSETLFSFSTYENNL